MKRAKYWTLAASVVLGLSAIAAEAQGPGLISSCQPITQPGSYFLTRNLTASQLVPSLVAKDLLRGDVLKVGQACVAVDHYAM